MLKDWHTIDTPTEKMVRQMFSRPKVALRRITDPTLRALVRSYDLNRGTQAQTKAWDAVDSYLRRG